MLRIDQKIFRRAKKGIRNFTFNIFLFQSLMEESISTQNIFINKSKYLNQEFMFINITSFIEKEFLKLIKIVILRKEIDSQGLTSKVRIAPRGRQVLESHSELFLKKQRLIDKLVSCLKYQISPR